MSAALNVAALGGVMLVAGLVLAVVIALVAMRVQRRNLGPQWLDGALITAARAAWGAAILGLVLVALGLAWLIVLGACAALLTRQ